MTTGGASEFDPAKQPLPYEALDEQIRRMIDAEWHASFRDLAARARKEDSQPIEPFDPRCTASILTWCQAFRPVMLELIAPYALCRSGGVHNDTDAKQSIEERQAFRTCRETLCPYFANMWRIDVEPDEQKRYAREHSETLRRALDALYSTVPPARCTELCYSVREFAKLQELERHFNERVAALCTRANVRCSKCGVRGPRFRCVRCHLAYYCDSKCQADDATRHQPACAQASTPKLTHPSYMATEQPSSHGQQ
jgi:hypothetical protein